MLNADLDMSFAPAELLLYGSWNRHLAILECRPETSQLPLVPCLNRKSAASSRKADEKYCEDNQGEDNIQAVALQCEGKN